MSDFENDNKDKWIWTMMIMQPNLVTKTLVNSATKQVNEKKTLPSLAKLKFEAFF